MKNLTPAKLIVMMMVAMGLLVAVYIGKTLLAKEPPRRVASRTIPMLVGDVEAGTVLAEHHLGKGPWPANEIEGDVLLGESAIIGRVVRNAMKAAEPIRGSALYPMNELPPLTVSDGHRAVTIHLTESAAIMNGLLRPGNHVDVEFTPTATVTSDPRYQEIGGLSIVLFKGIRILAINRAFVQSDLDESGNNVTLEVAEKDVAILRLADENGELYLSYTPDSLGTATVAVADPNRPTLEELLQLQPIPEPPVPPEPNVFRSFIYSGAGRNIQTFVDGVPSYNSYNNYGTRNTNPNQAPNNPNVRGNYGQPNGNNPAGVNPGFVPGAPQNGVAPGYGPQSGADPYGVPVTQNQGAPNDQPAGRTASLR